MRNPGVRFRHSGWANDRRRVYRSFERTDQSSSRRLTFEECGKHAYVFESTSEPGKYAIGGSTCRDRFCVPCGRERSRVIATNVLLKIESKQARFLTLTLKSNNEPLEDLLKKLSKDFASLRRSAFWKHKVTGGVAFMEVKWIHATQRWHPHLHCLIQGRYIPKSELSKKWLQITGTSYIIDITLVKDKSIVTHYITKYATKPLDRTVIMYEDRLDEAVLALKGKRLCLTFGTWRDFPLTTPLDKGTWINLGLLSEVVKKATEGDPSSVLALESLKFSFEPQARPPPPEPRELSKPLAFDQRSLADILEPPSWSTYE